MTKKDPNTNKALIEEFAKHSREYHNPREYVTRGKSKGDGSQENLAYIIAKLDTMDRTITKMGKSYHEIQVGCDNCSGSLLKKDCDLENGNKNSQVC